jgi:diacylglycerol kinase family enzyme
VPGAAGQRATARPHPDAGLVVLNPAARRTDDIREVLGRSDGLGSVRSIALSDDGLVAAIEETLSEGRTVVAAGGDGTVNAVAQHVVGRGTLGVLPGGTLNHFARDLGVGDLDVAVEALRSGRTRTIDVGRLDDDRYFLNNAGIGLYPELVYHRDKADGRAGTWLAAAGAAFRVLRDSHPVAGAISADGDERALLAWMVFLGNNRFGTTPGRLGQRDRMDEGILDVGLFLAGPRGARRSSVAWRVLRSRPWQTSSRLVRRDARRVHIRIQGPPRPASWDGEIGDPIQEMKAEIVPSALRVAVPPMEGA